MSLKGNLLNKVRLAVRSPVLSPIFYRPSVRGALQRLPGVRLIYGKGWELLHPFDLQHGVETSGYVGPHELPASAFETAKKRHIYAGSQPSIIRTVLKTLPPLDGYTFIDLGCGKGRPMMVASEFPFKELIGVELFAPLAETGQQNVATFRRRYPDKAPMRVENGDACTFAYPSGDLVVFLYNPFGEEVMRRVVAAMEAALEAEPRNLFIIYYNPVCFVCMDDSPKLSRYYAAKVEYAPEEKDFGPDPTDTVVIWQAGRLLPAKPGADAPITVESKSRASV